MAKCPGEAISLQDFVVKNYIGLNHNLFVVSHYLISLLLFFCFFFTTAGSFSVIRFRFKKCDISFNSLLFPTDHVKMERIE